tara:strand:+ start:309 stop:767 length:459 start_codon:yes stop_codon:yes gene_type:complete
MNEDTHNEFLANLANSHDAVAQVQAFFNTRGLATQLPPRSQAKSHQLRNQHLDEGDLFLLQRVEVKQRSFNFSGTHDYPFPTVFVSAKDAWDRSNPKPIFVVILSQCGKHSLFIPRASQPSWKVKDVYDARYDLNRQTYECPIEACNHRTLS